MSDWNDTLSTGERRYLRLATVGINGASLVVLDESTSALDTEAEEGLYRVLHDVSRARNVSYVSMGHRSSLVKYHDRRLTLSKRGGVRWGVGGVLRIVLWKMVVVAMTEV